MLPIYYDIHVEISNSQSELMRNYTKIQNVLNEKHNKIKPNKLVSYHVRKH